jgi:DNA modification methylase
MKQAAIWERIDALKPWKDNPRKNKGAINHVAESIRRFGFASPIIARSDDKVIIAGHTRFEAAKKLGLDSVPVRYLDLDPADSRLLALADNKIGEIAEWDEEKLEKVMQELLDEGLSLDGIGWSDDELNKIVDELKQEEIEEDEVPEADEEGEPDSKLGEVYELGEHRLMCGDSTLPETWEKLMQGENADLVLCDPPYGMGKEKDGVLNDNLYNKKLDSFQDLWVNAIKDVHTENASFYVWGNTYDLWRWYFSSPEIKRLDAYFRNEIVWNKNYGMGQNSQQHRMYPTVTERCLFFIIGAQKLSDNADNYWSGWDPIRLYLLEQRKIMGWSIEEMKRAVGHSDKSRDHWTSTSQWNMPTKKVYLALQKAAKEQAFKKEYQAFKKEYDELKKEYDELKKEFMDSRSYFDNTHEIMSDVWDYERVKGEEREGHPTPKPVQMFGRIIKTSCAKNKIVIDAFGGSGTTLIAAAQTKRRARLVELDPKYCDVIRRRWTQYAKDHDLEVGKGGLE